MRRTLNCVVCGKPAKVHTGHVHLPDGKKITSGLCEEHENELHPHATKRNGLPSKHNCTTGCDGDYEDWMRDSKKESQQEMWAIVDKQSLQQSMDMFTIRRKGV